MLLVRPVLVARTLTDLVTDIVFYVLHLLACYVYSIRLPVIRSILACYGPGYLGPLWISSWLGCRVQI